MRAWRRRRSGGSAGVVRRGLEKIAQKGGRSVIIGVDSLSGPLGLAIFAGCCSALLKAPNWLSQLVVYTYNSRGSCVFLFFHTEFLKSPVGCGPWTVPHPPLPQQPGPPAQLFYTNRGHTHRNVSTHIRGEDTASHSSAPRPQVSRYMQHSEARTNTAGLEPALRQAASHELVEEGAL